MKPGVLVVDDEEEICDYIRDILQDEGYAVKQAFCGEDVPAALAANEFNIAFVDLKLSTTLSGLDVITLLRQESPGIKIVAITGYVDTHLRQATENLGVNFFLEKPFKPNEVLQAVQSICRSD